MRKKIIAFMYRNACLKRLLIVFHILIGKNRFDMGSGNVLNSTTANIYKNIFNLRRGTDNLIEIGCSSDLHNSVIIVKGNHNRIKIGAESFINGLTIVLEGDHNEVQIGNNAFILNDVRMYVVDGSKIVMGNGCMLSDHIEIRTTDNHGIYDNSTGKRINYEEDVILHNKVWLGHGVTILKGAELAEGCIVGACSVVTRKHMIPNVVIAGNPAKTLKENVSWTMERRK